MYSQPSSLNPKIKLGLLVIAVLALLLVNLVGQDQPEYTEEEYEAYQQIADEANSTKKVDLAVQFLKKYPKSGLRPNVVAEAQNIMHQLYQAQNWQAVITNGQKIQAVDSENSMILQMLADVYQRTKNYSQFVAFGERAYTTNPSGNLAYYLAKAYLELGNSAKFFQWGDRAVQKLPDNHEILLLLTTQASGQQRSQQAAKYAGQCLKAIKATGKPENTSDEDWKKYSDHVYATCYYVLGNNAFQQNDYPAAVTNMENSVKYYKSNDHAYYVLGQAYWQQRKLDMAMWNFAKAHLIGGQTSIPAKQHMEEIYRSINRGSLAGLDRIIDRAREELR